MEAKFITFLQCQLGKGWEPLSIDRLPAKKQWIMERMTRFEATEDGAVVNLIDSSFHEIRLYFKKEAVVGVGSGMFYCESPEVIDTKIVDAPPEYNNPSVGDE